MSEQNIKTHRRYITMWHWVTGAAIVLVLSGSIITFVHSDGNLRHASVMLIGISLILASIFWYARRFALKAQDRAIRAEENFRHFILTGKPLDPRLRVHVSRQLSQRASAPFRPNQPQHWLYRLR